jgi:pimeloyl-ACP methyl ester carboxylesterase
MELPRTRYAKSGDVSIAYQIVGDGPLDLVLVPGGLSHLDFGWADPGYAHFLRRLASFSRLIVFDKRGMGMSDPVASPATLEERMEDIRVVMDAAGSERAAVFGYSEGGPASLMFAATYPERARAVVVYGTFGVTRAGGDSKLMASLPPRAWFDGMEVALEHWGEGRSLGLLAPDLELTPQRLERWGAFERAATSPGGMRAVMASIVHLDISDILSIVQAPTLVVHRTGDFLPVDGARFMAELIPDARFVELPGGDHIPALGDSGAILDLVQEFLTGDQPVVETDRVLATVLFTDIARSTEQAARLGDGRWRELLQAHDSTMRAALERFRGREIKQTGDGFLATFDGPARAVRCARAAIDDMDRLGLALRAGVHTGECELIGEDVGGLAVHIGARVAALAEAGEVVVSSTVKDLVVGSGIDFEDRGSHELKGVPGDWRIYAAVS